MGRKIEEFENDRMILTSFWSYEFSIAIGTSPLPIN
jgi:hypothetical protein